MCERCHDQKAYDLYLQGHKYAHKNIASKSLRAFLFYPPVLMYVGELQNKKRFQERAVFIPAEEREITKCEFNFINELCISLLIHIRDAFLKSIWRLSG